MFAYRGYLLAGSRGDWSFAKNEADAPTTSGLTTMSLALAAIDAIVDAPATINVIVKCNHCGRTIEVPPCDLEVTSWTRGVEGYCANCDFITFMVEVK